MKQKLTMMMACGLLAISLHAQNLAINADGSLPDKNAILDIKSGNKGLLIPRMSSAARQLIAPTKGLLVYDTTTNSFWYNTGTQWQSISSSVAALAATGPWLVTGNSGTDSTNFLGTTDNVPLNIRVNNFPSGRIDHINGNAFWGFGSGAANTTGNQNTGIGHEALRNNTTGSFNTATGYLSLTENTTGHSNTAYGKLALRLNTTGHSNTAVGMDALTLNTVGARNTAVGMLSLLYNTTGNENTATGFDALASNSNGNGNTANGTAALRANTGGQNNTATGVSALSVITTQSDNTSTGAYSLYTSRGNFNTAAGSHCMWLSGTGSYNTAMGFLALLYNQSGSNNTAIGADAMRSNSYGNYNTALGADSDVGGENLTNATAIGSGAIADASNKVRIGNSAVTVIEGQVPFTTPSDGRFKFNIQDDVKGLDFIMQLRPVTYQFDVQRFDATLGLSNDKQQSVYTDAVNMRRTGFIAQEVEQAAQTTGYNFSGIIKPKTAKDHYSLSYDAFVVPLVKAMQEQQQVINTQQAKMKEQDDKITELQQQLAEIKKMLNQK